MMDFDDKDELKRNSHEQSGSASGESDAAGPGKVSRTSELAKSSRAYDAEGIHAAASEGTAGSGGALPHLESIQAAFGGHDLSGVRAHTGHEAASANAELGSRAYAHGNSIAFSGAPDLFTAAHEAAHVVQQRSGIGPSGGVGHSGDSFEAHANQVAERVVSGQSAADLLGPGTSVAPSISAVQFIGTPLNERLPAGAETPEHGEDRGQQRRYSVQQYIEMWEKEQGRKMTDSEIKTIERGCIGITAMNLNGGGNPPLDNSYATFEAAQEAQKKMSAYLDKMRAMPGVGKNYQNKHAVLFAKMFWSNQSPNAEDRKKPDNSAYKPDRDGKVDMSDYKYRSQPGYINFDYAFWDETSKSFWHANHSMPGMKVYQSTKDKFAAGYLDFDRVIYCVAIAQNYDPGLAALATAR